MHVVTFGSKRNTTPAKLYTHYVQAFCEHLVFAKLRKASESAILWRNDDDTDLPPPLQMAYRTKGALDPVVLGPAPDDDGSTLSVSANEKHVKI